MPQTPRPIQGKQGGFIAPRVHWILEAVIAMGLTVSLGALYISVRDQTAANHRNQREVAAIRWEIRDMRNRVITNQENIIRLNADAKDRRRSMDRALGRMHRTHQQIEQTLARMERRCWDE